MTTIKIQDLSKPKTGLFNQILLLFLGSIFIFSGLIKLNDPVGTKIKLEEYFEVFAGDVPWAAGFFHTIIPFTLSISVFLCVLEVVLGVAVLLRYQMKKTIWALLGLVIFFTFLTFYSAYFNKVTDCGCFGDAIKLKPWESFSKDILLLIVILILFPSRNKIISYFSPKVGHFITSLVTLLCFGIGIYAIYFLPPVDFLPYKVGANLIENRKPSAVFQYKYIMEKDGKEIELDQMPSDTTYKFKNMVLLNPEAQPKIKDYSVWNNEEDFTEESLKGNKLFIIIQNFPESDQKTLQQLNAFIKNIKGLDLKTVIFTSSDEVTTEAFRHEYQLSVPYYFADATVLKTMIRTNPGLILLKNGVVLKKWPNNQLPDSKEIQENLQ